MTGLRMEELMGRARRAVRGAHPKVLFHGEGVRRDGSGRWRGSLETGLYDLALENAGYLRYDYGFRHDWGYYRVWFQGWINS